MTAHRDIGPTLEILMAEIAKELGITQDELPPAIEGILFNALLDLWRRGNEAAHSRGTIPPAPKYKTKTNPSFPPPSIDPSEEITKVLRYPRNPKKF